MPKNITVVDANGNTYEPTWPKRAKGLVKHGRARFVGDSTICLSAPPAIEHMMEETTMTNIPQESPLTMNWLMEQLAQLHNRSNVIIEALRALKEMDNGDSGDAGSPGNLSGAAKAEAIANVACSFETTNQQMFAFYKKIYEDLTKQNPQE